MVCAGLLVATGTPLHADERRAVPPRLPVALTTAATLPAGARDAAMREVQAIWQREGVHIVWSPSAPAPAGAGLGLRVLVVTDGGASTDGGPHDWPVAELVRDGRGQAVAIASVAAARRVLEVARLADGPSTLQMDRLGLVLGRAIAHEIGHYLLNTAGHARHGLMRTRISARDFADPRDGGFGLDDDAARWARTALTREPADALRLARFVYLP